MSSYNRHKYCQGYTCPPYTRAKYIVKWLISRPGEVIGRKKEYCDSCKVEVMSVLTETESTSVISHRRIQ